jgi:uncharacterized membrane-anchored protein
MKSLHLLPALLLALALPAIAEDAAAPASAQSAPAAADVAPGAGAETASAAADVDPAAAKFEASLQFKTGSVNLPGGFATFNLSRNFRFLDAADAKRVLEAWGNPPDASKHVLGMIFPAEVGPLSKDGWGVVVTYEKDGYVKDSDAEGIDYDKLLKEMQEATADANEERRKQGYPTVQIAGWAEHPSYDKAAQKLYWAKELRFSDVPEATLNYDIRVLGRYGVLSLNAVASMGQLTKVKTDMREVLAATEFSSGHRYADFNDSTDKVAAYGLAALVAGGVAAKMGLFAKLGVLLLSLKKVLIFVVAGAAVLAGKSLKRGGSDA